MSELILQLPSYRKSMLGSYLFLASSHFPLITKSTVATKTGEVTRNTGSNINFICLTFLLLRIRFLFPFSHLHWISKQDEHAGWELLARHAPFSPLCVLVGLYIITTHVEVEEVNNMVPGHKRCWEIGFNTVRMEPPFHTTLAWLSVIYSFIHMVFSSTRQNVAAMPFFFFFFFLHL